MNIELTPSEQKVVRIVCLVVWVVFGIALLVFVTWHGVKASPKPEVQTTNMYLFLFTSQGTNGTFTGNYRAKLSRVTANDFDQVQNLLSAQDTNRIWRVFNVLRFDE